MQFVNRNVKQPRELGTNRQLTLFRAFPFRFLINNNNSNKTHADFQQCDEKVENIVSICSLMKKKNTSRYMTVCGLKYILMHARNYWQNQKMNNGMSMYQNQYKQVMNTRLLLYGINKWKWTEPTITISRLSCTVAESYEYISLWKIKFQEI